MSLWQSLINPKVLLLALNYLGIVAASLGMLIFIPQIIKSLGVTNTMTVGWLTMIPYGVTAVAELACGQISDRMNERQWNLFIGCMASAIGPVIAGLALFGFLAAAVTVFWLNIPHPTQVAARAAE